MADADARRRAEEALAEIAAGDHGEYCGLRNGMLLAGGKTECYADCPKRVAAEALEALLAAGPEAKAPGHDRIAELESLLRECNAVCLCGCPDAEHEADECGESCGHDDHECIRVPKAVLAYVERLRSTPPPPSDAVREAWLVAESAPELNPSNYSHDDVCELNEAMIRVTLILRRAMGLGQMDAVRSLIAALSSPAAPAKDAVREAAEAVVCDDWWGHYCPCCGSTYKHGPECLIGRLAEALAEARAAAPALPREVEAAERLHPYADWHEDDGAVLWYAVPVEEPPYCGEPLCSGWPKEWNAPYDTVTGAFIDGPYTGKVLMWQRLPELPLRAALRATASPAPGSEGVREAEAVLAEAREALDEIRRRSTDKLAGGIAASFLGAHPRAALRGVQKGEGR